jgi:hypothetical protein
MLGTAAVSVGIVGLVVGLRSLVGIGGDAKAETFEALTAYDVWSLMLAGTVVLAMAVGVVSGRGLARTFPSLSKPPVVVGTVAYLLIVGAVFGLLEATSGGPGLPLAGAELKLGVAVVVVLLSGTPIVLGLWLGRSYVGRVRARVLAEQSASQPAPASVQIDGTQFADGELGDAQSAVYEQPAQQRQARKDDVTQLLQVYSFMRSGLTAVSIVIVAAVLTTGALRNALIDGGIATDKTFPESWLLLYGGFFSVLFATMFVPTLMEWRNVAGRLVDEAFPVPEGGNPDADWSDGKERMQKMLHLDVGIGTTLTSALGIFAPLISGAVAVFVSSFKAS